MYFSWEVPRCAEKCSYDSLGDGNCDEACFNPQCGFDLGDCGDREYDPSQQKAKRNRLCGGSDCIEKNIPVTRKAHTYSKERCAEGCPFLWIGDGVCVFLLTYGLVVRSKVQR